MRRCLFQGRFDILGKAGEHGALDVFAVAHGSQRGFDSDAGRGIDRVTVDAAGYGRKSDALQLMFIGQLNTASVRAGEQFSLVLITAPPDRSDRVNHVARG